MSKPMHPDGRPEWQGQQAQGPHLKPAKTYDAKCADLADHFLQDDPHLWTDKRTEALALAIQQTVEDFIALDGHNHRKYGPPRIYVGSGNRNEEWKAIRLFLLDLAREWQ